jgi:hypothetical protein
VGATELADARDYASEHTDFNIDIGVSTRYDSGISTGVVVKNLIPRDYETALDNTVSIEPQVRAGIAYNGDFFTLAADVDLTKNDPVGFENATRFVSLGGELDAWGWAQLRAGVRYNTVDSDRSTASLGIGLSPFNGLMHVDVAVIGSDSALGGAARLGMRF